MRFSRKRAYFLILAAAILLCLLYQCIWIFSRTTDAEIQGGEIYRTRNGGINFIDAVYQVNYTSHFGMYLKDGRELTKSTFRIRYLIFAPGIIYSEYE